MKKYIAFILQTLGLRRDPKEGGVIVQFKFLQKSGKEEGPASHVGDDGRCCVCLSRLVEAAETRQLPCYHSFHRVCVDRWLNFYQKTCPICRSRVPGGEPPWKEELTDEMVMWFSSFHVAGF